jgi:hypothetical protein
MKRCPHCANPVEENADTCPFCKADLTLQGRFQQRFERHEGLEVEQMSQKKNRLRAVGYFLIILLVAIGSFFAGVSLWRPETDPSSMTIPPEKPAKELEERDRQIQGLESQIAQLNKELEESSKRWAELQTRLEENTRALSLAQEKLQGTRREVERSAAAAPQAAEKAAPKPAEPPSPPARRRPPAEPGSYEVIRTTFVFEEPSQNSRQVATILRGTKVTVVGSTGEWLQVRSKQGNPPGFIRRDDAMFMESRN